MDHYKPHPTSAFEGYYSKFELPSGAHLALIVCMVRNAPSRPYMLSVTYVAKSSKSVWQREYWPSLIEFVDTSHTTFEMRVEGFGTVTCSQSTDVYDFTTPDFEFHASADASARVPWSTRDPDANPAGPLVHAPLPIQWHVQSLSTPYTFSLTLTSRDSELTLHQDDRAGRGFVHQEKNWANSFPKSYIWVQSFDSERNLGVCVAGGEAMPGISAYLATYTHRPPSPFSPSSSIVGGEEAKCVTMTPPFTLSFFPFSLFNATEINYDKRSVSFSFTSPFSRLDIFAHAPADTFFALSAPLPEGHRANYACESFAADVTVVEYVRSWRSWGAWERKSGAVFSGGSLEFGGDCYTDAGKKLN